ncbi:uncharacterized protein B0P05DRAFT_548222 [Gilbertella persicaria]|uniref:uncharacterized protein n=1 Tax=Gilbertella persicaria TaxID=101096 RepID=UPI0022201848|nr:uncharacterized protein B0P05DRAFT_548222 [Gilbertella persicaria]KAI8074353.1 hypothetical protein B0P05DRAFT_548222 [Gilbertella persicaria]
MTCLGVTLLMVVLIHSLMTSFYAINKTQTCLQCNECIDLNERDMSLHLLFLLLLLLLECIAIVSVMDYIEAG